MNNVFVVRGVVEDYQMRIFRLLDKYTHLYYLQDRKGTRGSAAFLTLHNEKYKQEATAIAIQAIKLSNYLEEATNTILRYHYNNLEAIQKKIMNDSLQQDGFIKANKHKNLISA